MAEVKDKLSRAAFLAQAPIFADLTENELAFLASRAVAKKYASGELIFSEGDPCPGLNIIESGFVKIFKSSASGREQVLAIDGPGHSIAELPVFDGGKYPASASAVHDTVLLFVSKQDFQTLCLEHPQVALKVLRVVGRRLRGLVAMIEELSFTTVRHRLASLLLRLCRSGKKVQGGIQIELPASNQEIAAQIGTVRELVSRNLSRLQAAGIIKMDGRTITIPDIRNLEAEIEVPE
ncbi:MAG TPA: Crp/Fnr family transcriptional regulator [Terriglobales bacterium]|nr:Crp/Fnr family transcriptional regulator [Terriglobales bacterium]